MPRLPAMVSEITEPTKARVTATFSDAKKYGIARGRPILSRMSMGRTPSERSNVAKLRLQRRRRSRR
jgi:hypothetical protein